MISCFSGRDNPNLIPQTGKRQPEITHLKKFSDVVEFTMAVMMPADVECFNTEGEKQTYFFLQAVAKPDNQYLCWYLPHIQQKEPDFVLSSESCNKVYAHFF